MAGVSIKIQESLAEKARVEALAANRSLTGQIEHWVRIGLQAEERLTGRALKSLKQGEVEGENQGEIEAILTKLAIPGVATDVVLEAGGFGEKSVFSAVPGQKGVYERRLSNGNVQRGILQDGDFVPFLNKPSFRLAA